MTRKLLFSFALNFQHKTSNFGKTGFFSICEILSNNIQIIPAPKTDIEKWPTQGLIGLPRRQPREGNMPECGPILNVCQGCRYYLFYYLTVSFKISPKFGWKRLLIIHGCIRPRPMKFTLSHGHLVGNYSIRHGYHNVVKQLSWQ